MPIKPLTLADVLAAAKVIRGRADGTPLVPSQIPGLGQEMLLKLETTQPMGAFKLRGALTALAALPPDAPGVVCCSTGNHGRAIAYAAREMGLRAVVCMSALVPAAKVAGIRALGAEVRIIGRSQDDAAKESRALVATEGLVEIPPFDDARVIAGQGTIGLELLAARPDLSTLLLPLSGGGLAAGVALAAKAIKPGLRVIGISMERGAAMQASIAAGHPVAVTEYPSLADSLGGGIGLQNRLTLALCRDLLDEVVLVDEVAIRDAMQALFFHDRMVAEGSAVVGLAAVMTGAVRLGGPAATILTGRNTDMTSFADIVAGRDLQIGDIFLKGRPYGA
ncbi:MULTISPECIES: hydroxyectoine utilization dehydratase EutB [Paracoccaceae]|jgi:threonine dehydratase|uniref:hydroxyectoine utilization dehydratase EutB n=1 Tax=Paracoccaceae TaxID=31989 RepID=UPI00226DA3DB|nr:MULTISPECIES: hydroxyectoine utilization dehydratase EutB [Paracoccaceae]MCY1128740.1 hydroxyectoine utilization dehydratase EutB [Frigidibacter sp. RF13]MDP3196212.1 hydroxyectoine utilization dehydratase EutB [Tabrizicola sp.]